MLYTNYILNNRSEALFALMSKHAEHPLCPIVPAKAGTQTTSQNWLPAFAGKGGGELFQPIVRADVIADSSCARSAGQWNFSRERRS